MRDQHLNRSKCASHHESGGALIVESFESVAEAYNVHEDRMDVPRMYYVYLSDGNGQSMESLKS
jgi:hypothetical protein